MNEKVKNLKTEILSNNWYTLKKSLTIFLPTAPGKHLTGKLTTGAMAL